MKQFDHKGFLWHWGHGVYRFRWAVLILWIVIFLSLATFAQKAPGLFKDNGFTPVGSDSDQGLIQLDNKLDYPTSSLTLLYQSQKIDLTTPQAAKTILDSLSDLRKQPYITDIGLVTATRLTKDNVLAVNVNLNLDANAALDRYPELKASVHAPAGMSVMVTGGTAILHDMQVASKRDIAKAEVIGLPIAVIVLLIVFGTLLGAVLPLIVGLTSVTITLGIAYFIVQHHSLSNFLPNIVTMLGLAVGIDYALFVVSRFREELIVQKSVQDAVAMTCQKAGQAILFSGLAVLIGLCGMLFIHLSVYSSLCMGGVMVVLVSVLVANSLLLALLGIFGAKINAFQVLPVRFRKKGTAEFWGKIAHLVMKRPITLVVVMGAILLLFAAPLGHMILGVPSAGVLPPSYDSRSGSDLFDKVYDARETSPILIYVQSDQTVWNEKTIVQMQNYIKLLRQTDGVESVQSYLDSFTGQSPADIAQALTNHTIENKITMLKLAKDHSANLVVIPQMDPESSASDKVVKMIRKLDAGGLHPLVTGATAYRVDMLARINQGIPKVVAFVMIVTYFVLLFAFRSAILPLKAVLMNLLSLGSSLGIVVIVFQYGFLAHFLHITSTGYVSATLPVLIFCVVFGISMDYEVFLISRIAEEYERTGDNEQSTVEGLKKTGSLITSAAFILIVVVGAFIFADIEVIKALGLGLSLAVFIDATFIRITVVPALMKLLGRANWWAPRFMKGISKK